jgi:hypothetical protein
MAGACAAAGVARAQLKPARTCLRLIIFSLLVFTLQRVTVKNSETFSPSHRVLLTMR